MRIAGSLWSVPAEQQGDQLSRVAAAGLGVVHWDASDGTFATAGGFTSGSAQRLLERAPGVTSEAHLMMHNPFREIPAWAEFCTTIVVPCEVEGAARALDRVEALGVRAGVAVSLPTPLDRVPADLPVLLMAIPPGEAGSPFDPAVVERVDALRQRGRNPLIGVDGGVGTDEFGVLAAAGANWIVSGTSLFGAPDPGAWLRRCARTFSPPSRQPDGHAPR
jgi:ribulose-phosphate 3-epimerase